MRDTAAPKIFQLAGPHATFKFGTGGAARLCSSPLGSVMSPDQQALKLSGGRFARRL